MGTQDANGDEEEEEVPEAISEEESLQPVDETEDVVPPDGGEVGGNGGVDDDSVSDLESLDLTPPASVVIADDIEPVDNPVGVATDIDEPPIDIEDDENAETELDSVDSETRRGELVEMGLL